jgi:tetratricopeptide (TPR) repeat protein
MRRFLTLPIALALVAAPVLAADRGAADAAMRRAITAFDSGDARTARVEMQNALKADPGRGQAHVLMARIFLVLGDAGGARAELDRAARTGIARADISHLVAHALVLSGDGQGAIGALDAAPPPRRQAAYAARVRGQALALVGDLIAAEAAFGTALAMAPRDPETWVALGRFRMDAANQAGAVDAADRAIAIAPASVDALLLKGVLVRNQYGLVAALPWFERAVDADPQDVDALLETAATLGDLGRMRDMLAMTRRALAVDGGNSRAFYLQAVLAARARNDALARALIRRTGDALEDMPGAMLLNAVLEIQSGSFEQAIARLDRLTEMQPENLRVRRLLGTAQWRAGNYRDAAEALRPIADRPDADAYTLSLMGRSLEAMGDQMAAAPYLDRAASPGQGAATAFGTGADLGTLARDATIDRGAPARIRYIRGLIASGDGDRALDEARALQSTNPGTPAAHLLVGDALTAIGRPGEAAEAYRLAANISFSEPIALRLIDALDRAGNRPAALEALRLFLSQNPRNVSALLLASDYLQRGRDWDASIRILEGLRARMGNRDALILNNLAWAWTRAGDVERGLIYARHAYALAPSNPAAADTLGWLLYSSGRDRVGGRQLIEKAAAIAPDAPLVRLHLSKVSGRI